jgi:hypothetical protein
MSPFRSALAAATILTAIGGVAIAQTPPAPPSAPPMQVLPTYDAAQLPAFKGKVAQYTLTPRGDVDGLILDDGTQVQIPPPFSTQVVYAIKPGDAVTVHGLKARALPLVQALSVTNDASHVTVTLSGFGSPGHGMRERWQPMEDTGKVKAQLHGPRGEINGVLLEDGTVVHMPPPAFDKNAAELAVGQSVYVSGGGMSLPYGKVIGARMLGTTKADAKDVGGWPGMHGWMHGMMRGWMGHDGGPEGMRHEGMEHGGRGGPDGMMRHGPGPAPAGDAPPAPAPK